MIKSDRIAGLDGLRFISITFVVLLHLFTFKSNFGYDTFYYPILETIGGVYGVQFFFIISGFLLTYLLLKEVQQKGAINLKAFYLRRVLRIWPAYYLLVVIALLLVLKLPFFRVPGITDAYISNHPDKSNLFYLLFLPHIAPYQNSTAPFVHHTYTIGIEEQFYLLWGALFFFFRKHIASIFIFILVTILLMNIIHETLFEYASARDGTSHLIILIKKALFYVKYSKISTFTIGSLFGYAYFKEKNWVQYFRQKVVQVFVYLVIILSIIFNVQVPYFHYEYVGLSIACLILIATFKQESVIIYNSRWLSYLGKISYGIYLFHIFAIFFAIKLLQDIFQLPIDNLWQLILLCFLTLSISVFLGWLSYTYFEKFFLKLKYRFNNSGEEKKGIA